MAHDPFATLDAVAQAELVRRGEVAPHELVDAAALRIERLNPTLNAVIHPALEQARERARSSELQHGPLRGVPTLMKDIGGAEAGRPNHAGMRFLKEAHYTEKQDSHFTQRLKAAGLVSLGRTNTPELALLATTEPEAYGATHNPWKLGYSPGGSSGGAAAAVAAGLVPVAHASDGGGSIRGPASNCALVGLKPTRGRCSFGPGLGERWSGFSNEFMLTRSVRDAALLLDVCAGAFPGDPYSAAPPARPFAAEAGAPLERLRIGVMRRGPRDVKLEPENLAAVDAMARTLEGMGHVVEEAHPEALDDPHSIAAYVGVVAVATARALQRAAESVGREVTAREVEPLTFMLSELGKQATAVQHVANLEYVHAFGRRTAAWWASGFDLLLTPTAAAPPPEHGYLTSTAEEPLRAILRSAPYGAFTLPWNLTGQPAISLPCRWTGNELPIGIQLVAAVGREDLLLRMAAHVENATPWASRRPSIHA